MRLLCYARWRNRTPKGGPYFPRRPRKPHLAGHPFHRCVCLSRHQGPCLCWCGATNP